MIKGMAAMNIRKSITFISLFLAIHFSHRYLPERILQGKTNWFAAHKTYMTEPARSFYCLHLSTEAGSMNRVHSHTAAGSWSFG